MKSITTKELKKILDEKKESSIVIDVRPKNMHEECTIKGAKNIRPQELLEEMESFKKFDHVYLHCNRGGASGRACKALDEAGLKNVVNIEGGLKSWIEAGFEVDCS